MKRNIILSIIIILTLPLFTHAQSNQDELRREVRLYNPFKPSLNKANKLNFFPEINDTIAAVPEFQYDVIPKAFMPDYKIRSMQAARLQPDPLPELYKGYLNLGFGNYFSPLAELSISSDRSRKQIAGLYISHESSYGKLKIDDNTRVYGGYMDNYASLYATKLFRRANLGGVIDFNHIRRYAYGGDPVLIAPETGKDSLRIEYFNPRGELNLYSTRLDSSKISYDLKLKYDLLYQNSIFYQHLAAFDSDFGYDFDIFYATLGAGYQMITIPNIEDKLRHKVVLSPAINKRTGNWSFILGARITAAARYFDVPSAGSEYKTKLFFHPDLSFSFNIIPSILKMYVGLDGEYTDNTANQVIYDNPFVISHNMNGEVEADENLYTIQPTDVQLRVKGGFKGFATEKTGYSFKVSYSMFNDMLFYINDAFQGRGFTPVYDSGELLRLNAGFYTDINDRISISGQAGYYDYRLETLEEAWNKQSWDGVLKIEYNLRDKIIARTGVYAISKRYGRFGPMSYSSSTDYQVSEMPMNLNLNLNLEYRYTKILSFWMRVNNISLNRYYEWNLYPSRGFLFMAGFTYSL